MKVNIANYDFHDGYLIDIKSDQKNMVFLMESAQINSKVRDNLELSKNRTLKGKLHLENIQEIKINENEFFGKLKKIYDDGDIFEFNIQNDCVTLIICWKNYTKNQGKNEDVWVTYQIRAETIYWENLPNLHNPFWNES